VPVPGAPTNVAYTDKTPRSTYLHWTAPATAPHHYNVYSASGASGSPSGGTLTKLNSSAITGTSFVAPADPNATTTYVVRSVNVGSGGTEAESARTSTDWLSVAAPPALFTRVPYADMTLGSPSNLPDLTAQKTNTGNPGATASFITAFGTQCKGAWGGSQDVTTTTGTYATTLASRLSSFRTAGGQLVLAFGGLSGFDIAQKCTTAEATRIAYKQAIDAVSAQYGQAVNHIDLDVESNAGSFSTDTPAIDRQSKAVAALQEANPLLVVTYTLQTEPTTVHDDYAGGMMTAPKAVLANAKANGVRIDGVNGMAMDYGGWYSTGTAMGQDAISVAQTIRTTLAAMYPSRTDADLWRMVGITPMIGRNDITNEVFTLADMITLATWAKAKPIGMLGMWSVSRDKPCSGQDTSVAQPDCHSIVGGPAAWAFGKELAKFTP
jgi:chitinase